MQQSGLRMRLFLYTDLNPLQHKWGAEIVKNFTEFVFKKTAINYRKVYSEVCKRINIGNI